MGIAPDIPVFDKSKRDDWTFLRSDFRYDPASDVYRCRAGKGPDPMLTLLLGKPL